MSSDWAGALWASGTAAGWGAEFAAAVAPAVPAAAACCSFQALSFSSLARFLACSGSSLAAAAPDAVPPACCWGLRAVAGWSWPLLRLLCVNGHRSGQMNSRHKGKACGKACAAGEGSRGKGVTRLRPNLLRVRFLRSSSLRRSRSRSTLRLLLRCLRLLSSRWLLERFSNLCLRSGLRLLLRDLAIGMMQRSPRYT